MRSVNLCLITLHIIFSNSVFPQNKESDFNFDTEKQSVEKTINSCIGWAKNKELNVLYSVIANDSNYIEVDPGDRKSSSAVLFIRYSK